MSFKKKIGNDPIYYKADYIKRTYNLFNFIVKNILNNELEILVLIYLSFTPFNFDFCTS